MELRALKLQVQRMRTNAPAPKVVEILAVLIGNFACFDMDMKPEGWTLDAYDFRDGGRFDRILSPWAPESHNQNFPLVTAHTRVSVMCRLSSIIPDGMDRGQPFTFQLSLVDPKA
jgi:hypothetical protein